MSNENLIKLELIKPNPWQPREDQNPEEVEKLAFSINSDGLLQIPVARPMEDGTYQLAFGHRRYAAFQYLRNTHPYGIPHLKIDYSSMPLIIRELTDEDMFRFAVSENLKRQDLTAIEEAKAMTRYRDEFGKTSAEIGELFGLSDATVRGKIRLLKLPAVVQDLIRKRQISEGAARALIGMYDLPDDELLAAEEVDDEIKPSDILEIATSGAAPQQIANQVERLIERIHPTVKQIELPEVSAVSKETAISLCMDPPETYYTQPQYQDEPEEIPAEVLGEAMPDEEKQQPAAAPEPVTPAKRLTEAYQNQVAQAQKPAPTPSPAPAPVEQAKPLTWAESTITLTITLWPEDGNEGGGRMVMIGGRVNQETPSMQMLRMEQLNLSPQLAELLENLNKTYQEKN